MTVEEAIVEFEKQLHSAVVVLASGFGTHPGENDRIYRKRKAMAEIALSALRAQQGAKWISVKDRLPELIPCTAGTAYSEAVIVWTSGRKAMIAVYDGIDFMCAADYWDADGEMITHWMPLPEPPKEG